MSLPTNILCKFCGASEGELHKDECQLMVDYRARLKAVPPEERKRFLLGEFRADGAPAESPAELLRGHKHTGMWMDEAGKVPDDLVLVDNGAKLFPPAPNRNPENWMIQIDDDHGKFLGGIRYNGKAWEFHGDMEASAKMFCKFVHAHWQSIMDGDRDDLLKEPVVIGVDPAKDEGTTFVWPKHTPLPGG